MELFSFNVILLIDGVRFLSQYFIVWNAIVKDKHVQGT